MRAGAASLAHDQTFSATGRETRVTTPAANDGIEA